MVITSLSNAHIKEINKLKEKKHRDLTNTFLIEGEHLVREAIKENLVKELIVVDGFNIDLNNIPTTYVSKEVMNKLSDMNSFPNVMAICNKQKDKKIGNKVLLLEDIQDPGNLGTMIRSAVAFNVDTIILSPKTVDLYNPKVLRATQGMLFSINIVVKEPLEVIPTLKEDNYKILGTKVDNGSDVKTTEKLEKFILIIGNEGQGMTSSLSALCDEYLYIKMNNSVESLNAAVAASILLYELGSK